MSDQRSKHRGVSRGGKGTADARVRARAAELVGRGMPSHMANAVAHGRLELNAALERMARSDRVNALMNRHGLSRALATQVAIGHADLDQVLARQRLSAHRTEHRDRTCLEPGRTLALALTSGRIVKGVLGEVTPYGFQLATEDATLDVHKLEAKYSYDPADWKRLKKGVKIDRTAQAAPAAPSERPQNRYGCSDKRLFGYLDGEVEVLTTLLEGERLRGHVRWFGRYEFGMTLRGGVDAVVFRHALARLAPVAPQGSGSGEGR